MMILSRFKLVVAKLYAFWLCQVIRLLVSRSPYFLTMDHQDQLWVSVEGDSFYTELLLSETVVVKKEEDPDDERETTDKTSCFTSGKHTKQ